MKNISSLRTLLTLALFFLISTSFAFTRYWRGTSNANWNDNNNWSNVSGGGTGFSFPTVTDIAIFDAGGNNACSINVSSGAGTLTVTSGYTNTITQSAGTGNNFSIGAGGASLSGGTFAGGNAGISCTGSFTLSGMAFTSTSTGINFFGGFTLSSGSFTHNNGAVIFLTSCTITGSATFYNLIFGSGGSPATFTISGGTVMTVANTLTLGPTNAITINTGEIDAQGNITVTNTNSGGGGSALIKINGTGSQTLTGSGVANTGKLPKVEVNKASGTLTLASIISLANDWTYVTGTVSSSGTPNVETCASLNLDGQGSGGTMSFYDLTVYGGTTTLTGNIGISHDLTINTSQTLNGSSYTMELNGKWNNNGTFTYSTSTVQLQGSALQTINTSSSTETFYNLILNKPSGRVLLNDPLIINNSVTFTEGILKTQASGSHYLKLIDNATAAGGNDSSFVWGTYKKVGNEAFTFALGDTSVATGGYHPLSIGAPSSVSDAYTAQFFNTVQTQGGARDSILNYTSTCEHWNLARDVGSSNVTVKLGWNSTSCNIDSLNDLRVAYWNGSKWKDKGGSYTGNTTFGDVVTSAAQSAFGYFIIAKKYPNANAGTDVFLVCDADSALLSGSTGTSYSWSPGTGLSCTTCPTPYAAPATTITYTYTVTYPSGWQSSDNLTLTRNSFTSLTPDSVCNAVTYTVMDSVKWFTFVADTDNVYIEVKNLYGLVDSNYASKIDLFSGTCGNLALFNSSDPILKDSIVSLPAFGITTGATYIVKVTFTQVAGWGHIDICAKDMPLPKGLSCSPSCDPCGSLVRNGKFEVANCPNLLNGGNIFPVSNANLVHCWFNADNSGQSFNGTPDYFNSCATQPAIRVPNNFTGTQTSHNGGSAYAGFYAYLTCQGHTSNFGEYIEQELCSPMIPGEEYACTFYVNLSDMSTNALDHIGMYISTGAVSQPANGTLLKPSNGFTPQIVSPAGAPITSTSQWTPVTGTYTAIGGEDHITIGCFREASTGYTRTSVTNVAPYPGQGACTDRSFYLIDDVSIVPVTAAPTITGGRSLCDYSSKTLSVPSGYTCSWSVSPTPNSISGANTTSVTFGYVSQPVGNVVVTLTYTSANGCAGVITYTLYECCACPGGIGGIPCSTLADMNISAYAGATPLKDEYYINGVVTIDANTTMEGATVRFGPNAKIDILPGYTLTIKDDNVAVANSVLYAGCLEMWDGIYINGTSAKLVCTVTGGSAYNFIEDAINAVVSDNGGDYDIQRTKFQNDYIGVKVKPYSGSHTGVIKTSLFTNTNGMRELQLPPYANVRSYAGFEISSVYDLTVGVIGSSLVNTFEKMDYGIHYTNLFRTNAYLSTLRVYNNFFTDIVKGVPFNGIAIVAEGEAKAPISLKIGNATTNAYNTFDNCTYGIFASQFCKTEVKNNDFNSNVVTDITCLRNLDPVTITDNTSAYYNRGIWVIDHLLNLNVVKFPPGVSVDIGNNTFATASSQAPQFNHYENTAILVQNVNLKNIGCIIHDNNIQDFRYGIITTFLAATKIYDNVLSSPLTPDIDYHILGIYDEYGRNNIIENNTISYSIAPVSGDAGYLRGIYAYNSRRITIRHNSVTKYYDGITAHGSCHNSLLYCNSLTNCYMGFNFKGNPAATIGDQLPNYVPTGNQWISGIGAGKALTGDIKPEIDWNYVFSGNYKPLPTHNLALFSLDRTGHTNTPTIQTSSDPCISGLNVGGDHVKRQLALEDAILDTVQMTPIQDAYSYFNKKYAYESLRYDKQDTSWLDLGYPDDAFYQDFYDSCETTNLAAYATVQEYMDTNDVYNALIYNTAIMDSNQFESDRKLVNDIYINTWLSGIYEFTTPQYDTLDYIAHQHASEYGDAVISARVLLGLEVEHSDDPSVGLRKANPNRKDPKIKQTIIAEQPVTNLYPNPAKDEIRIDASEDGELEMYNLLGEKVIFTTLVKGTTTLSTAMLKPGIYIYSIYINDKVVKRDKLVINQ